MLRNNLDYIKEQLAREEKFVRKEIEQIKLEQQNLKETLEKINQKVDKLLEQRNIVISEEQKLNNLLKQFENFNLGESDSHLLAFRCRHTFSSGYVSLDAWV